ncbi:Prenyl-dependent CAAX protease, putative isoform 1 [Hibiscus syriacus]|uniref:Prenyl-dependent CAAX protease, putative isoform 1 n=1 Tax=Hibiscus syriacus TaxID=106335 RepID=A0A6A2Z7B3_HIBSY|nr:Prenyl-dependent CAAX protease, putative isoform 1 [Hibiscus syriacus]
MIILIKLEFKELGDWKRKHGERCRGGGGAPEKNDFAKIVEEIVKLRKKIFPEHERTKKEQQWIALQHGFSWRGCRLCYVYLALFTFCFHSRACSEGDRRRQGHGEALLKAAIQKCRTRNVHRISLHVDPLRIPTMGLYKKLGFQVDSLIKCG